MTPVFGLDLLQPREMAALEELVGGQEGEMHSGAAGWRRSRGGQSVVDAASKRRRSPAPSP